MKASPLARRIASERGIDLCRRSSGTGPEGRIVAEDVERAAAAPAAGPRSRARAAGARSRSIPLTGMRKTIARRMTEAWEAPALPDHHDRRHDAPRSACARRSSTRTRRATPRPTYSDILTKVCAVALMRHRAMNALFAGEEVHLFPTANVGIAVAVPNGLVVPVLRSCETKTIPQLAAERADLVERTRAGKLQQAGSRGRHVHDLEPRHVRRRALRRRPQPAAGRHPRRRRDPGARGRRATARSSPGPCMELTLTCDHRSVDGATASEFLAHGQAVPRRARPGSCARPSKRLWYLPSGAGSSDGGRATFYRVRMLRVFCRRSTSTTKDRWARLVTRRRRGRASPRASPGTEASRSSTLDVGDVKAEAERLREAGVEVGTVLEIPARSACSTSSTRTATASSSPKTSVGERRLPPTARTPGIGSPWKQTRKEQRNGM